MIEANNNKCKPDLKAQLKGYLNQWLAYGYLGALELHRRVLCLTSHLCLVTTAGSGCSHNGCTGWSKRLYARVEPSGNFKRVSVPLLNTSGWLSWSRNSDKSSRYHTVQRKSKTDRKAEEGSRQMHHQSNRNLWVEEGGRGKQKVQKIKTNLIPAIALCLDERYQSLQEPVIQAMRNSHTARENLPSEIYSLLLSPILDNTIFRNDFRGQPRAVNSGELHGNLILC